MIIAFSGTDYSGKSTQIKFLKLHQRKVIVWSRFGYTPLIIKIKKMRRGLVADVKREKLFTKTSEKRKNVKIVDMWFWSGFVDYVIFGLYLHYLRLIKQDIVCDRYILDVLVDLSMRYHLGSWHSKAVLFIYKLFFPKPDTYLYLDIDLHCARLRREKKIDPYPISDSDFIKLQSLYRYFLEKLRIEDIVIIDASCDPGAVANKIATEVASET